MNILIIGLGYAGNRFLSALHYLNKSNHFKNRLDIAYVDKMHKNSSLIFFSSVANAISTFQPDIIIVTVNDEFHADILNQLIDFKGFVICEKPLANTKDDLELLRSNLANISGFCFDMIERYSAVTSYLKTYIKENKLVLIRAHFCWGKDRINDHRPTCGVTSEVIHSLDLIQYLTSSNKNYQLTNAIGTCSDFSISGTEILDSVSITAYLGTAVITGYSSFVNITRKREIDLTFVSPENKLIYTTLVFDTPEWDIDYLKIWEKRQKDNQVLVEIQTDKEDIEGLQTIKKLTSLVNDVLEFVERGLLPKQTFPNLNAAIQLQYILNKIDNETQTIGPVKYVPCTGRDLLIDENNLERLG